MFQWYSKQWMKQLNRINFESTLLSMIWIGILIIELYCIWTFKVHLLFFTWNGFKQTPFTWIDSLFYFINYATLIHLVKNWEEEEYSDEKYTDSQFTLYESQNKSKGNQSSAQKSWFDIERTWLECEYIELKI